MDRREFLTNVTAGAVGVAIGQRVAPLTPDAANAGSLAPTDTDALALEAGALAQRGFMLESGFAVPMPFGADTHNVAPISPMRPTYSSDGNICNWMSAREKNGASNTITFLAVGKPGAPKEAWRFLEVGINLRSIKQPLTALTHGNRTYALYSYDGYYIEINVHEDGKNNPQTFIPYDQEFGHPQFLDDVLADDKGLYVLAGSAVDQSGERTVRLYHLSNKDGVSKRIDFKSRGGSQRLFDTGEHIVVLSSQVDKAIRIMNKATGQAETMPFIFDPDHVFPMPGGDMMMLKHTSSNVLTAMRMFIDPEGMPRIRSAITIDNFLDMLPSYLDASGIRFDTSPGGVFHTPDGFGMMVHVTNGVEQAGTRGILFMSVDKEGGFPTGGGQFSRLNSTSPRIVAPPVVLEGGCYGVTVDEVGTGDFIIPSTQPLHLPSVQA